MSTFWAVAVGADEDTGRGAAGRAAEGDGAGVTAIVATAVSATAAVVAAAVAAFDPCVGMAAIGSTKCMSIRQQVLPGLVAIIFAVVTKDQSSNCSRDKNNRRFPAKDAEVEATFAALFSRGVFAATLFTAV